MKLSADVEKTQKEYDHIMKKVIDEILNFYVSSRKGIRSYINSNLILICLSRLLQLRGPIASLIVQTYCEFLKHWLDAFLYPYMSLQHVLPLRANNI